jgi:anti-sigma regulatory factor (Ser/Thr protein kinase)
MIEKGEMERNLNQKTVEVILSNRMGYERIAMACSASFARIYGLAPERIEDLKTIVSEAAMNAMEHGNKGKPEARVTVSMNIKDDTIHIRVTDAGDGIKALPVQPNILRIMENIDPPAGLGLFLIKNLADHVEFNDTTDKGHCVAMAIKIAN